MGNYVAIQYPKWVDGVVVQNAAEEQALWAAPAEAVATAPAALLTRPLSPAGIRMRRTRMRRQDGKVSIRCDISTVQIEALARAGFIDPAKWSDAAEVARGVGRLMDRLTRSP